MSQILNMNTSNELNQSDILIAQSFFDKKRDKHFIVCPNCERGIEMEFRHMLESRRCYACSKLLGSPLHRACNCY